MKRISSTGTGPSSKPSTNQPRRRVLYVEDDDANRLVASMRLEKTYELLFAKSDREACATFIERGAQLSLILMDIELKGSSLNGMELTQLIKGRLPLERLPPYAIDVPLLDIPVLFVTGYGEAYPRRALLAAGGEEVLAKPIDFVALHTAMTRVYINRLRSP